MSLKYNIWTIGCQMNEADSRHLGSQLEALGYGQTDKADEADLVVMNTCVVRQQAEDRAVGRLHHVSQLKKHKPDMTVGLMGCMVGMREAGRLKEQFPFVDVFMPPSDTEPLMTFLDERGLHDGAKLAETRDKAVHSAVQDEEYILPALQRRSTVLANVPIVLGCSHACTFCIIPYRRGAERSRAPEDIVREVQKLASQGVREVMLLGQIVDRYGCDFEEPYDLADLLRDVAEIEDIQRVRFLTGHPNYMTDKMIEAVRDIPKVCPHFEVPVQAGNDKVLEDMRRGYTADEFCEVVKRIRKIIPDAAVNTDIIVGFPGETKDEFMDTYRLLEELRLDKVHLAKYSERPKTIAARQMPDDVSEEEKERRRLMIDQLVEGIVTEKNKRYLGERVEVLIEREVKGKWRGRTPDNRLVFIEDPRNLLGAVVNAQVNWAGPWSLLADKPEVVVEPFDYESVANAAQPALS